MKIEIDTNLIKTAIERAQAEFGANFSNLQQRIETAKPLDQLRTELARNADIPTIASSLIGELDLPSILSKVDPSNISSIFPNAPSQFLTINNFLTATTQSSRNDVILETLTNSIRSLLNSYTVPVVLAELDRVIASNGINSIDGNFRNVVKNAISTIVKDVTDLGVDAAFPVTQFRVLTEEDFINNPESVYIVSYAPDLYVQKYYVYENDPYPGYEEWHSKDNTKTVYVRKKIGDYYYESLQEEIEGESERYLTQSLEPCMKFPDTLLTPVDLSDMLLQTESLLQGLAMEKIMGSGSSSNLSGLLDQLLGYMASPIQQQLQDHLPDSVLNTSSIENTINQFSENMAMLQNLNGMLDEALRLPEAFDEIANIDLTQLTSNIEGATVELNNILRNLGNIRIEIT